MYLKFNCGSWAYNFLVKPFSLFKWLFSYVVLEFVRTFLTIYSQFINCIFVYILYGVYNLSQLETSRMNLKVLLNNVLLKKNE